MLLNEFLKEHRAFLEEQRKVETLRKNKKWPTAGLQSECTARHGGVRPLRT